jgi:hypothetical protein
MIIGSSVDEGDERLDAHPSAGDGDDGTPTAPPTVTELPPVTGWGSVRMEFQELQILVQPTGPTSTRNCVIATIDLKMPLPPSLVALVGRKVRAAPP